MTTTVEPKVLRTGHTPHPTAHPLRFGSVRDLAKFGGTAAVLAMFVDAAIGHALLWENDPYWTYWVTDTFLLGSVFILGTAWLGASIGRGAVVAAVQTLILTTYYWAFSPIGLPGHAEWLDLQHTWVTGPPVHFGVYFLGYLLALWLWRRRPAAPAAGQDVGAVAGEALLVGVGVVVVVGLLQAVALGEFPGVTWFVVRALVATVFTLLWWAAAGRDRASAVGGGILLAFVLTAYSHYLGPVGLPDTDLRLLAQDPPPSSVHWLSYQEEWFVAFPITLVVALVALLLASARTDGWTPVRLSRTAVLATVALLASIVGLAAVAATATGDDDRRSVVTAAGTSEVAWGDGESAGGEAELRLVVQDATSRRTPLPPHDAVDVVATVAAPDGTRYEVVADEPMVSEPHGRFGTWYGVGFDKWHHGRSGIGSAALPETRSEVAAFALGEVRADGDVVARGVPVHVGTVHGGGVELAVGDPASPVPALPGGYLRAGWPERSGSSPEAPERARNALGGAVLVSLLLLTGAAVRRDDG